MGNEAQPQASSNGALGQTEGDRYLGIDPDTPIYRIFPLWFFHEALRLRQLVLVRPSLWADPFELLLTSVMVESEETVPHTQESLERHLFPVHAQCWSVTHDSDILLRAYSRVSIDKYCRRNTCPGEEGVRVRSTPRKLLESLRSCVEMGLDGNSFIGAVRYHARDDMQQMIANEIGEFGLDVYLQPLALAHATLRKRREFRHEAEVRLLHVETRPIPPQPLVRYPFEPNEVFDEVTFDPRLRPFERDEREVTARALGYAGPFQAADLYQRTLLVIRIKNSRRAL